MKKIFITIVVTLIAGAVEIRAQQYQYQSSYQTNSPNYTPHADMEHSTAIQLSLTPDVALYPRDTMVRGLSLNIWGENPQQSLTLGFVNGSTGDSGGFSWGIVNYDEAYRGVQWGLVNVSRQEFTGWQGGLFFFPCVVNVAMDKFTGFQEGVVNYAEEAHGFQLGLVNYSQDLQGLQIGLINVAMNNPWFTEFPNKLATGFPIINWSF